MCEHLSELENELKRQGIPETCRGQVWTKNCREWVYFDCYLDIESLRKRFHLPGFIKHHINNDTKSGLEEGFECELCKDAIMGLNRRFRKDDGKRIIR
ncbi:MAG: hypothetical protein JXB88_22815 [Spirochaetales bacterium]|nr:hypothetical protein [Spirochaetales bacterium]